MPLPKSATLKERSAARLQRYHSRQKAKSYFGDKAVRGKHVHHRNGKKDDNHKWNFRLKDPKIHGKHHGRGNKGGWRNELRFAWRRFKSAMLGGPL